MRLAAFVAVVHRNKGCYVARGDMHAFQTHITSLEADFTFVHGVAFLPTSLTCIYLHVGFESATCLLSFPLPQE